MSSTITRRQLLARTGGAGLALAGFGLIARASPADSVELSAARRRIYAGLLAEVDAQPAYEIPDRDAVAERFAQLYAAADEPYRGFADATLDALEPVGLAGADPQLGIDALTLVKRPFIDDEDLNQLLFSV